MWIIEYQVKSNWTEASSYSCSFDSTQALIWTNRIEHQAISNLIELVAPLVVIVVVDHFRFLGHEQILGPFFVKDKDTQE